jgi:hypothetical protein
MHTENRYRITINVYNNAKDVTGRPTMCQPHPEALQNMQRFVQR